MEDKGDIKRFGKIQKIHEKIFISINKSIKDMKEKIIQILKIIHEEVEIIRLEKGLSEIEKEKGADGEPTTKFDKIIEDKILDLLKDEEVKIITEERGIIGQEKQKCLLIDPIDGTSNAKSHIPFFSTSIALMENKKIVEGFVIDHSKGDIFYAKKGEGAYLNDKKIISGEPKKGCLLH